MNMDADNNAPKVAVLISGRGSNMEALIKAAEAPDYPAKIALVVSNNPDAGGLQLARQSGIATAVIDHKAFSQRADFEAALDEVLQSKNIDYICLAGFMRVLTPWFVERWQGKLINIHPSLLPAFKGLETHKRALEAGVHVHGCTVHYVSSELDSGDIIARAEVQVLPDDTEETLAARVLEQEHQLYAQALRDIIRLKTHHVIMAKAV